LISHVDFLLPYKRKAEWLSFFESILNSTKTDLYSTAAAGSDTVFTFGPTSGRPIAGVVINAVNFTGGNSDSTD
jgi:hypothetical protein